MTEAKTKAMTRANGWDACDDLLDEMGLDGDILTLKHDGDFAIGVFLGEPFGRVMVWNGKRYVEQKEDQPIEGRKSARFMFNMYVSTARVEGKEFEVNGLRAVELNKFTFQKGLLTAKTKYAAKNGGLDRCQFELKRDGAKGDQKTVYHILFEEAVKDPLAKVLEALDLIDLPDLADQLSGTNTTAAIEGSQSTGRIAGPGVNSRGLIDANTAGNITGRLRALGAEVAGEFKTVLTIGSVREIKENQKAKALQMLGEYETKANIKSDPFG